MYGIFIHLLPLFSILQLPPESQTTGLLVDPQWPNLPLLTEVMISISVAFVLASPYDHYCFPYNIFWGTVVKNKVQSKFEYLTLDQASEFPAEKLEPVFFYVKIFAISFNFSLFWNVLG